MTYDVSINGPQGGQAGIGRAGEGLREGIRALVEAVRGGDLSAAREAHDRLSSHPAARGRSPLSDLLRALSGPLVEDDVDAAQQALIDLRAGRSARQAPQAEEPGGRHDREKVREAVRNLIEALRSDELDAAQLAYAQLVELSDLQEHGLNGPFGELLGDIGEAPTAGDANGADDLFAGFVRSLNPGSAVDVNA